MKTPNTAQEQTVANLDGDPMTGYDQQVAFDGDPSTRASLRFWRDGNILNDPDRVNAFNGNGVHRPNDDPEGSRHQRTQELESRLEEDLTKDLRAQELRARAEQSREFVERRKTNLPTPFDRRAPSPFKS